MSHRIDAEILDLVRCPLCRQRLAHVVRDERDELVCPDGHRYPVVEGVPWLTPEDRLRNR